MGLSPTQARSLLSRLARRRLVARVRRDLYLLPRRIPPGGRWSPSEFLALATLMADRQADYQICGPATFHRYGWDSQVPQRLDVYNTAVSGIRQIGAATFCLIQVAPERLGGTEVVPTPDGVDAVYSSRARSLVDALYDWSRFGSLPAPMTGSVRTSSRIRDGSQDHDGSRRVRKHGSDATPGQTLRTRVRLGAIVEKAGGPARRRLPPSSPGARRG